MSNIFLSENASRILKDYIEGQGHSLQTVKAAPYVYPAVSAHPDIYMCKLGASPEAPVFHGNPKLLGYDYPGNIRYNAVCIGQYFIHSLRHTDPALLSYSQQLGKLAANVKQGYTKCNTVVVDDRSVITSDLGIAKALSSLDIDILTINPGHVRLSGFPYGFLGGASGRVGEEIIFNGDLSVHPDFRAITQFIQAKGLQVKYFKEYPLEDIGSIYEETCNNSNIYTP